jgi:hypothetical protein
MCRQVLVKIPSVKCYENQCGTSRAVTFGRTDGRFRKKIKYFGRWYRSLWGSVRMNTWLMLNEEPQRVINYSGRQMLRKAAIELLAVWAIAPSCWKDLYCLSPQHICVRWFENLSSVPFWTYCDREDGGSDYSCRTCSTPHPTPLCHPTASRVLVRDYLTTSICWVSTWLCKQNPPSSVKSKLAVARLHFYLLLCRTLHLWGFKLRNFVAVCTDVWHIGFLW